MTRTREERSGSAGPGDPDAASGGSVLTPFLEVKHRLDGSVARFRCALVHREPGHAVLRYDITGAGGEVAGLYLPGGTETYAYYWTDRPYNVYHWVLPGGRTAGHYFNLADRTVIAEDHVEWTDLTVDILVTPDGELSVLDEDELPQDLAPDLRAAIENAKSQVLRDREKLVPRIEERTRAWLSGQTRP